MPKGLVEIRKQLMEQYNINNKNSANVGTHRSFAVWVQINVFCENGPARPSIELI